MGREAVFQGELQQSALEQGFHPIILEDEAKKSYRFGQSSFGKAKPYDMALLDEHGFVAMELKDSDRIKFPLSEVRQNQWDGLQAVHERGWPALLVVNYYVRLTPKQQQALKADLPYYNCAFVFPYKTLKLMQAQAYKSVSILECRMISDAKELHQIGEDRWDLKTLMKSLRQRGKTRKE